MSDLVKNPDDIFCRDIAQRDSQQKLSKTTMKVKFEAGNSDVCVSKYLDFFLHKFE